MKGFPNDQRVISQAVGFLVYLDQAKKPGVYQDYNEVFPLWSFPVKWMGCLYHIVNTLAADALAPYVAIASLYVVMTYFHVYASVFFGHAASSRKLQVMAALYICMHMCDIYFIMSVKNWSKTSLSHRIVPNFN